MCVCIVYVVNITTFRRNLRTNQATNPQHNTTPDDKDYEPYIDKQAVTETILATYVWKISENLAPSSPELCWYILVSAASEQCGSLASA